MSDFVDEVKGRRSLHDRAAGGRSNSNRRLGGAFGAVNVGKQPVYVTGHHVLARQSILTVGAIDYFLAHVLHLARTHVTHALVESYQVACTHAAIVHVR